MVHIPLYHVPFKSKAYRICITTVHATTVHAPAAATTTTTAAATAYSIEKTV